MHLQQSFCLKKTSKNTRDEEGNLFCVSKQRKTVTHSVTDYVAQLSLSQLLFLAKEFDFPMDPSISAMDQMPAIVQLCSEIIEHNDDTGEKLHTLLTYFSTINMQLRRMVNEMSTEDLLFFCHYYKICCDEPLKEEQLRPKLYQTMIAHDDEVSNFSQLTKMLKEYSEVLSHLTTQRLQVLSSVFNLPTEESWIQLEKNIKLYMMSNQLTMTTLRETFKEKANKFKPTNQDYLSKALKHSLSYEQILFIANHVLKLEIDDNIGSQKLHSLVLNAIKACPCQDTDEAWMAIEQFMDTNERLDHLLQNTDYSKLVQINQNLELDIPLHPNANCSFDQEDMTNIISRIKRDLNHYLFSFEEVCQVLEEISITHNNDDVNHDNNYDHPLWMIIDDLFLQQIVILAKEWYDIPYLPSMTPKGLKETLWNHIVMDQNDLHATFEYCIQLMSQNLKQRCKINQYSDLELKHLVTLFNLKKTRSKTCQ